VLVSQINRLIVARIIYGCAKYAGDYGEYALSTIPKVLLRRDCALSTKVLEGVLCVLELLEAVRRVLEAVQNCALCAVGMADDAAVCGGGGGCAECAWRCRRRCTVCYSACCRCLRC